MRITKNDIVAAMSSEQGFEVVKDHTEDGRDGAILVSWKGMRFYISFNSDDDASKVENEDDFYRVVSNDFAVTFAVGVKEFEDKKIDVLTMYKLSNYVNMKSDLNSIVVFREDADLFEIGVRHTPYNREQSRHQLSIIIMTMALTGVMAVTEVNKAVSKYIENPEGFFRQVSGDRG